MKMRFYLFRLRKGRGFLLPAMMAVVNGLVAHAASAAEVTAPPIYQVAETIGADLALLHHADLLPDKNVPVAKIAGLRPRYVLMAARSLFDDVQTLRYLNGLKSKTLPPLPVRAITLADVRDTLDEVAASLADVRPIYGIDKGAGTGSLRDGVTASDIYARIQQDRRSLRALGLPATVPNDVYRVSLMIIDDVHQVAAKLGGEGSLAGLQPSTRKTPAQVYDLAYDLLVKLSKVEAASAKAKIPGGVVLPPKRTEGITPADVVDVLYLLEADLNAMKAVLGITTPEQTPPPEAGRTPSDSFDALSIGRMVLANLAGAPAAH